VDGAELHREPKPVVVSAAKLIELNVLKLLADILEGKDHETKIVQIKEIFKCVSENMAHMMILVKITP